VGLAGGARDSGGASIKNNYKGLFTDWELRNARSLVKEFQGDFSCLGKEGFEDLLQECLTHWFFVKDQYGNIQEKTHKPLLKEIIKNKLHDIFVDKEAQKRKMLYKAKSLDEILESSDEDSLDGIFTVHDDGFQKMPKEELSFAIAKASQGLSLRQRRLCKVLGEDGLNIYQASKVLKIPRTTIYEEISRIREVFRKEGLDDYLRKER